MPLKRKQKKKEVEKKEEVKQKIDFTDEEFKKLSIKD